MSSPALLRPAVATRPLVAVLALVLALALAACGVPTGEDVTTIEREKVPYRLLETREPAGSATASAAPQAGTSSTYFVDGDRLVPVPLPLTSPMTDVALGEVMAALSMGPSPETQDRGLGTTLPPSVRLVVLRIEAGTATIELQSEEVSNVGEQGPLATGQIVLSATSVGGIDRVLLTRLGAPVEAQLADGALTSRPLTAADYATLTTRPSSTA